MNLNNNEVEFEQTLSKPLSSDLFIIFVVWYLMPIVLKHSIRYFTSTIICFLQEKTRKPTQRHWNLHSQISSYLHFIVIFKNTYLFNKFHPN